MKQTTEEWKDIEGYEGLYQISNLGFVKTLERKKKVGHINTCIVPEKILNRNKSRKGYLQVTLSKNGKLDSYRISRLVAQHFIPNTENKPQVNHIDGNKDNNDITNLEWVTNDENISHAIKNGLYNSNIGENSHYAKLTRQQVEEIKQLRNQGWKIKDLGNKYNITGTTISRITTGKNWVK